MTMIMLKDPQLDRPEARGRREPALEPDPAILCARLRELAFEAHQAVRARDATGRSDFEDLHERMASLRSSLHAQRLDSLAGYVSALERTLC